jgi:hypothetical protein
MPDHAHALPSENTLNVDRITKGPGEIKGVARGSASAAIDRWLRAFSSEVNTGSRQENASNQESRARFDSIETGL